MPLTKESGISCFKNLRGTRGEDHSDEEGEVCFRYREWGHTAGRQERWRQEARAQAHQRPVSEWPGQDHRRRGRRERGPSTGKEAQGETGQGRGDPGRGRAKGTGDPEIREGWGDRGPWKGDRAG